MARKTVKKPLDPRTIRCVISLLYREARALYDTESNNGRAAARHYRWAARSVAKLARVRSSLV